MMIPRATFTEVNADDPASYVGVWKSAGGFVRQELLPDGRYSEVRGKRASAAGHYYVSRSGLALESDSGALAGGTFKEGALHQDGMIFYKVA